MDADRLRSILDALHWTQQSLAELTGVNERQVRRWIAGATIPQPIADWLELRLHLHEEHPAPARKASAAR